MGQKEEALALHSRLKGKIEVRAKKGAALTKKSISLLYTPGVAAPCMEIASDKAKSFQLTGKSNTIAVISDGSAVLGLGNIGPEAAMPVMEGKALLFMELAGVNAFPIVLKTGSAQETVQAIRAMAPSFGGINLEDIAAPNCFFVEKELQDLGIPVVHDDQHATAVVVLAGMINAFKLAGKKFSDAKIVLSGCGAAGTAITKLLYSSPEFAPKEMVVFDRFGAVHRGNGAMPEHMKEIAQLTRNDFSGTLSEALQGADVFIGVSAPNILKEEDIKGMNKKAIVFAMANPVPEIAPELALKAGAFIVGTGRSDYKNQINNVLVFPGLFRGLLDARAKRLNENAKIAAAKALAASIKHSKEKILPHALDKDYVQKIVKAVKKASE
ncbi:MAG: NADP-dependent malic enzyme [Candidatus Diapherotrites archaeon]